MQNRGTESSSNRMILRNVPSNWHVKDVIRGYQLLFSYLSMVEEGMGRLYISGGGEVPQQMRPIGRWTCIQPWGAGRVGGRRQGNPTKVRTMSPEQGSDPSQCASSLASLPGVLTQFPHFKFPSVFSVASTGNTPKPIVTRENSPGKQNQPNKTIQKTQLLHSQTPVGRRGRACPHG